MKILLGILLLLIGLVMFTSSKKNNKSVVEVMADPLEADNEKLSDWTHDLIAQFEKINITNTLSFTNTLDGIISESRSVLKNLKASTYLTGQIDNILILLENVKNLVVEGVEDETLDLEEVRDISIESLTMMGETFVGNGQF